MITSRVQLALVVVTIVLGLCNLGVVVDGAEAIYVFGDSYLDTGNRDESVVIPYGSNWPGHPFGRASDGRLLTDYFAELFGLPTPPPYLQFVKNIGSNSSGAAQGLNFARGGAGVTYAFGIKELEAQVDEMEALVRYGTLTPRHLRNSVALINIGTNDYNARNLFSPAPFQDSVSLYGVNGIQELETFVQNVVDGYVVAMMRLHSLGVRNMVVLNLPLLVCLPYATLETTLNFQECSTNATLLNETAVHNSLLQARVKMLNQQLQGMHVIIADQTKAFAELFYHGNDYGFENPLKPCCLGNNVNTSYIFQCSYLDAEGKPLYTLCPDPNKAVLFDTIHPTQAAHKVMVDLYAFVPGYTLEGPELKSWIKKYNV